MLMNESVSVTYFFIHEQIMFFISLIVTVDKM